MTGEASEPDPSRPAASATSADDGDDGEIIVEDEVEVEVEDEDEGEQEEELGTLARNVERGILLNKELYVFTITFKICDSTPKLQKIHRRLTTSDDDDDDE